MGENPFDVRIARHDLVIDQVRRDPGGLERIFDEHRPKLEVKVLDARRNGRMDEGDHAAPVHLGIERRELRIADVHAVLV